MERLEEMIRESLEARAGDVEATPELWDRVDARIARRRWLTVGAWSVTAAAAVLVAAVVVPGLVRQPLQPDVADTPSPVDVPTVEPSAGETPATDDPTDEPTAETDPDLTGEGRPEAIDPPMPAVNDADGDGISDLYVSIDGAQGLSLRATADDTVVRALRSDVGPEGEGRFDDVAVRPGSTAEHLDVAVAYRGEGFREVRLYTFIGGAAEPSVRIVANGEDAWPDVPGGVEWDEAGDLLAWLAPEGLVVARMADIERLRPYPEDPFGLRDDVQVLPVDFRGAIADWAWYDNAAGSFTRAAITLADGLRTLGVAVQADAEGRLALDHVGQSGDGRLILSDHSWPGWSDGGRSVGLRVDGEVLALGWSADGDQSGTLPLGGDLDPAAGIWLDVDHGGHLVGKSDGVWLVLDPWTEPGSTSRRLPDVVRRAAFVPRLGDALAAHLGIQAGGG